MNGRNTLLKLRVYQDMHISKARSAKMDEELIKLASSAKRDLTKLQQVCRTNLSLKAGSRLTKSDPRLVGRLLRASPKKLKKVENILNQSEPANDTDKPTKSNSSSDKHSRPATILPNQDLVNPKN